MKTQADPTLPRHRGSGRHNATGNQGTVLVPAIAAERIKFFSLRSLTWMLWLGIICMVGTAWLLGASAKASGDNGFDTYTPAPELLFSTFQLAQLFFATAAALCLTTEYSSGTITSSLQAVPRRGYRVPVACAGNC